MAKYRETVPLRQLNFYRFLMAYIAKGYIFLVAAAHGSLVMVD